MDAYEQVNKIVKETRESESFKKTMERVNAIMEEKGCSLLEALLIMTKQIVENKDV